MCDDTRQVLYAACYSEVDRTNEIFSWDVLTDQFRREGKTLSHIDTPITHLCVDPSAKNPPLYCAVGSGPHLALLKF
jgi:hypothetical protein